MILHKKAEKGYIKTRLHLQLWNGCLSPFELRDTTAGSSNTGSATECLLHVRQQTDSSVGKINKYISIILSHHIIFPFRKSSFVWMHIMC